MEEKLKTVLSIFSSVELNKSALTESQKGDLVSTANDYGLYGGDAVYFARGFLHMYVEDEFEGLRVRKPQFYLGGQPGSLKDKILVNNSVIIIPNPASNHFSIKIGSLEPETNLQVKILDLSGRIVYSNMLPKNAKNLDVNCSEFENGSYLVHVYSSEELIGLEKLLIIK